METDDDTGLHITTNALVTLPLSTALIAASAFLWMTRDKSVNSPLVGALGLIIQESRGLLFTRDDPVFAHGLDMIISDLLTKGEYVGALTVTHEPRTLLDHMLEDFDALGVEWVAEHLASMGKAR